MGKELDLAKPRPLPLFDAGFFDNLETFMDSFLKRGLFPKSFMDFSRYGLEEIKETKEGYVISVPLPGVKKENMKVSLEGNILNIAASDKCDEEKKGEEKGVKYHKRRHSSIDYKRSFQLPPRVKDLHAKYKDGMLEVTISKPEGKQIEEKKIEIEYEK